MNITLVINIAAALALASAAVLVYRYPLSSVGLAYVSGLLTAFASRFHVAFQQSP